MGPQMLGDSRLASQKLTGVSSLPSDSLSAGLHWTALLTLCGKFLNGTEAQGPTSPPDNVSTAFSLKSLPG